MDNTSRLNPITEFEIFKKNLEELNVNINRFLKNIFPLLSDGLKLGCSSSRNMADLICKFQNISDKINNGLENNDLKIEDITNVNKLVKKVLPKSAYTNKLVDNLSNQNTNLLEKNLENRSNSDDLFNFNEFKNIPMKNQ